MATETTAKSESNGEVKFESRTGWLYIVSKIREDVGARISLVVLGIVALVAIYAFVDSQLLGYYIANHYWYNPLSAPASATPLLPPVGVKNTFGSGSWAHPLGTDSRGRDVLVRLVYGSQIAIEVGLVSTTIGMVSGTVVGAIAGYYGGWVDDVLMRLAEILYSIPFLVLVIAFMTAFGPEIIYAMIGVSIISIPIFARLIRSQVLSVREETYVEAARAAGVRDVHIIRRHIVPNSFAPVIVQATLQMGQNILIVAGLTFLGFGAQPPTPSWGQMLSSSRTYMLPDPWFSVWPGLAILVTVIAFNVIGDGLRDTLDPRLNN